MFARWMWVCALTAFMTSRTVQKYQAQGEE